MKLKPISPFWTRKMDLWSKQGLPCVQEQTELILGRKGVDFSNLYYIRQLSCTACIENWERKGN